MPEAREDGGATAEGRPDPRDVQARVKTNCGSFTVTLDEAKAPATHGVARLPRNLGSTTTLFHRTSGFVIQGGDPTQKETEAGYQTSIRLHRLDVHEGIVAMASWAQARHRGSQFFIVSGPNAGRSASYASSAPSAGWTPSSASTASAM